jgi:hypothetical protein
MALVLLSIFQARIDGQLIIHRGVALTRDRCVDVRWYMR